MFWDLWPLWVGLGVVLWILLWRSRAQEGSRGKKYRTCPRCTASLQWGMGHCDVCQWPSEPATGERPQAASRAVHRMLYRFRELGLLSEAAYQACLDATGEALDSKQREPSRPLPLVSHEVEADTPPLPAAMVEEAPPVAPVEELVPPAATLPPREMPVADRAREYAARRAVALEEAPLPAATPKPKRDWGKVFQGFLESHNIMWGELVGGLLIVVCSIALVISFWAEIAERPLLKFGVFSGVSAALFAAGFYTDRRWRIRTTSHGVLIIAILLVPLNFLAIAAFTSTSPPTDFVSLAGEGISLAVFAILTWFAARTVTSQAPLATAACVMTCSLMQLVIRRFAGPEASLGLVYLLASVPLASYAGAVVESLRRTAGNDSEGGENVPSHFVLLGICLFSTLLPLALLVHKVGSIAATLQHLAPLLVVLGGPALATTVILWRRIPIELPSLRIVLGSIGALGGMMFLASVGLSWPLPAALLATALANVVLWIVLAWCGRLPWLHFLTAAFLAVAWLVGIAALMGEVTWQVPDGRGLTDSLLSAVGGARLLPLVALYGLVAAGAWRLASAATARVWGIAAGAAMGASVALLVAFGFGRVGDPADAAWYFAAYAALAIAAAMLSGHGKLAIAAVGLTALAAIQWIVFRHGAGWADTRGWIAALLALASVMGVVVTAVRLGWRRATGPGEQIFTHAALGASVVAAALLVALGSRLEYNELAIGFLWLALLWLALAWLMANAQLFVAFQIALAVSLGVVVTSRLAEEAWFAEGRARWVDPWFWQAQGIALAASAVVWRLLRLGAQRTTGVDFSRTPWPVFDRTVAVGTLLLVVLMAAYSAFPGMARELSPSINDSARVPIPMAQLEFPHVSSAHAGEIGAWMLLAAVALLVGIGAWDRAGSVNLLAMPLLAAAACLLGAAQFTGETATASALRWLLSGAILAMAVPIVARRQLRPLFARLGLSLEAPPRFFGSSLAQAGRTILVALVVLLYAAIAAMAAYSALAMGPPVAGAGTMLGVTGAIAGIAAAVWLVMGLPFKSIGTFTDNRIDPSPIAQLSRTLVGISATLPLVVVVAYIVARKLTARPLLGPDPASWFGELGNSLLYGGPLALVALMLLALAIRELSSRYAFSFGLLAVGVATLVYLLELAAAAQPLDAVAWIRLAQLNGATAAVVALGWWGWLAWRFAGRAVTPRPMLLQVLAGLAVTFSAETLLAGCVGIVSNPMALTWEAAVADWRGLVTIALAAAALWLTTMPRGLHFTPMHVVGLLLLAVTLVANLAVHVDSGQLEAYHTLLVASTVASWLLVTLPVYWRSTVWAMVFAAVTTLLALIELEDDTNLPFWPWWGLAGLLSTYGVLLQTSRWRRVRWPTWFAAPVLVIAGHVFWWNVVPPASHGEEMNFFELTSLLFSLAAIASVLIELSWTKRRSTTNPRLWIIGFHRFGVWFAILWLLLGVGLDLAFDFTGQAWGTYWWLGPVALVIALGATFLTLWDRHVRWPVAAAYCLGLTAVGWFLGRLELEGEAFTWAFTLALAAFVLASSYLWQRCEAIAQTAIRWGAPRYLRRKLDSQVWMLAANGLAIAVVVALVASIELTHEPFRFRMTAAYAVLACALGVALMATGRVETVLRYVALAIGGLFAVAFAWAWIPPSFPVAGLHRLVAAGVALAAVIPIYGTLLVKIWRTSNPWVAAAQRTIPVFVVVAGLLLAVTLATEASYFIGGNEVPLVWPAVLAVAVAVAALVVSSLAAALLPGRDPLNLSERGRTAYVYAAEVFAALLFLHIRVTMPWLFSGWFLQYWPFIVMLIAFVGVGLSEWFARRKTEVLAEPLRNTGILLPLLPVVGFWSAGQMGQYALLLLAVGALYMALSVARKSPIFLGLALLAFNGSLWTTLHSLDGWGLAEHPQFWLIPPVVCVLIGAELNRKLLTSQQLSGVRYSCAIMIYAASTADIFINGVGPGLWLPMVLAALSIAGVFAGILLRVRAFLFLGVAFLCVSLFSVVWHAAVELERTWIWWVAGIASGVAIIVLFGLFEKKRDEALRLVEELKQWES